MGEVLKQGFKNFWVRVLSVIAVVFLAAGLIMPPTGVIDSSVLIGVGEIFGFATLSTLLHAMDIGKRASVRHNATEITVE